MAVSRIHKESVMGPFTTSMIWSVCSMACAIVCGVRFTKALDRGDRNRMIAWVAGTIIFAAIEIFHIMKLTS